MLRHNGDKWTGMLAGIVWQVADRAELLLIIAVTQLRANDHNVSSCSDGIKLIA